MARRQRSINRHNGSVSLNNPQRNEVVLTQGFGLSEGETIGHGVAVVRLSAVFHPNDTGTKLVLCTWGIYVGPEDSGNPSDPGGPGGAKWLTIGVLNAGATRPRDDTEIIHASDGDRTEWHGQRTAESGDRLVFVVDTVVADDQPYQVNIASSILRFSGTPM